MFRLRQSPIVCLAVLLLACAWLVACRSAGQPQPTLEAAAVAHMAPPPTATTTPASLATAEPTLAAVAPTPVATSTAATPLPDETDPERGLSATRTPARPTALPPTPQLTPVPCPTRAENEYVGMVWERSGALPLDVSLANAHYSFLPPHDFFIGVQNWIGIIRLAEPALVTTDPFSILTYGFEEVSGLPPVTDIEAQADGLLYLTGGSRLTVIHADDPCYLVPLATADFPFPAHDVEVEGKRIYVGGSDGQQLHITVLDRTALPDITQLATLIFPPGIWSVVGEQLLTYDQAAVVTISDLANLSAVSTRQVAVPIEPEPNKIGPPQLFGDAFSLLVWGEGLLTMSGLLDDEPVVTWRELDNYFHLDFPMLQENHAFVVYNWCDVGCTSGVYIADRDPEGEFKFFSLYPHHPVFHYHAIQDDVVLAFSDYSLIVLDVTAPEGQEIVRTYPLRGRLDR